MNPTETQLQNSIMGYLRFKRWYVQRMNSGALRDRNNRLVRMMKAGTPDLMAFRPLIHTNVDCGRKTIDLIFIEVKVPGNKPTILQQEVMKELEEYGARCLVIHSVDELEELL